MAVAEQYARLEFDEAITFFRDKLQIPAEAWDAIWGDQHNSMFIVAGVVKSDLLADIHAEVTRAIAEGKSRTEFVREWDDIVSRRGWSPMGWHGQLVYDTNIRQAYNAGRETQMQDPALLLRRPFGLYRHGEGSLIPRPMHLSWDGLVIRMDDPWWSTHTPQNGFNCKCKKFMLNQRDVDRLGTPPKAPPDDGTQEHIVRGKLVETPSGVDPSFDYRPGGNRDIQAENERVSDKVASLTEAGLWRIAEALGIDLVSVRAGLIDPPTLDFVS